MKLPDALFQDVTGLSAPAGGDPVDDDRRAAQRVFLGQRTTLHRDAAGVSDDAADAMIGRVSVTGLGVVCERAIAIGEVFTLLLPRLRGDSVPVRCAAVTCHPCAGGSAYLVGAVYRAVLSDQYAPPTHEGRATGARPF